MGMVPLRAIGEVAVTARSAPEGGTAAEIFVQADLSTAAGVVTVAEQVLERRVEWTSSSTTRAVRPMCRTEPSR
jgi:hypothetical protein